MSTPTGSNDSANRLNESTDKSVTTNSSFNCENFMDYSKVSTFNPLLGHYPPPSNQLQQPQIPTSMPQQKSRISRTTNETVKEEIKSEKEDEEFKRNTATDDNTAPLIGNADYESNNNNILIASNGYSTSGGFSTATEMNWLNGHGIANSSTSKFFKF